MNTKFFYLCLLAVGCLYTAQAERTEWEFRECKVSSCGGAMCRKVNISFSPSDHSQGYYSPINVMCVDNSPRSYLLTRCPKGFFNTFQNTSGVCKITAPDGTGTDLLLRGGRLVPGLHPFDCLVNATDKISSSAIVATDDNPYRDVLAYINGVLQLGYHNNTNITVNQGDNLAVVVRGVGNIANITANDTRFTCMTQFACNTSAWSWSGVSNRYLECSLNTPAEPSDNGRTLTVVIDSRDQMQVTITVKEKALSVATASHPQPTSVATATGSTGHGRATIKPTIAPTSSSITLSSSVLQASAIPTSSKGSTEMSKGVIAAVIIAVVAVILLVILLLLVFIFCMHKRKYLHKNLHTNVTKHTEEAAAAPPTTSSKPASLRRSSITSADGQQAGTLVKINAKLQKIEDKIDHNAERTEEQLERIEDKTEEVSTGVSALMTDNTNSLRRQTSAS